MTILERLWIDHVVWTRQAIVSTLGNLPDTKTAIERLFRNQIEIGQALAQTGGKDFGHAAANLLIEHIEIALEIVQMSKPGNRCTAAACRAQLETLNARWQANALAIAKALSSKLPTRYASLSSMMLEHLRLTSEEVRARAAGDWRADAIAFDAVLSQAITMARMLAPR